jgi:plasmid maintenance system killer protein
MDIVFKNHKIEKEFNDERALRRNRGDRQAELIMQRMTELKAAAKLEDMRHIPGPRCHELKGNLKGQLSVDLNHPYRLLFVPNHEPVPQLAAGGLDWTKVTQIRILGVQDTHE